MQDTRREQVRHRAVRRHDTAGGFAQEDEQNRTRTFKQREKSKKDFMSDYDSRFKEGVAAMADALATAHTEKREASPQCSSPEGAGEGGERVRGGGGTATDRGLSQR